MAIIPDLALGSLWTGDVPPGPTRADFYDEAGNVVQISEFTSWTAEMFGPDGVSVGTLTGTEHGQHLEFPWPTTSILETAGIYLIEIKFYDALGVEVTCEPFRFVVQEIDGWLTLDQARQRWADAPQNDVTLSELLAVSRAQCVAYAPALALGAVVPATYREAQYLQARAIYMSSISNQADSVGVEGYQVRSFPLDWNIRALLRPKKAIGGMF